MSIPTHVSQSVPHFLEAVPHLAEKFNEVWPVYYASHGEPADPIRIMHLMLLIEEANKLPHGDFIELGTHKGYALRVIHKLMHSDCHLYSLDTFEGFDAKDIVVEKQIYANNWHEGNFLPTSVEAVASYVGDGSAPRNLSLIKGWFPETFSGLEARAWRFVHIDFDLYQPIKSALELLWPNVVPGGVVMIHDYGCFGFPGARIAVDNFCQSIGVFPLQLADRWGTAVLRKSLR